MAKKKKSSVLRKKIAIARRLSRAYDRLAKATRADGLSYIRSLTQNNKPRVIFKTKVREARINGTFDRYTKLKEFYGKQKSIKNICSDRKSRRSVLFALRRAGRGIRTSRVHNWTHDSYTFCR